MAKNLGKFLMVLLAMTATQVRAAGPSDVDHIRARSFSIPIDISGGQKDKIKELELYVSTDEGKTWTRTSVISPDKSDFTYTAPVDGLYWFRVCTVDKMDNREPKDIYKSDRTNKILVDTLPPTLRIVKAERQGENIVVFWEIQELNPDLNSFKLEYKTAEGYWYPVSVTPSLIGQGQFRSPHNGPVTVRVTVSDMAGNQVPAETMVAARADDVVSSFRPANVQAPSGGQNVSASPPPVFPAASMPAESAPNPPFVAPSYATSVPAPNPSTNNSAPVMPNNYGGRFSTAPNAAPIGQGSGFQANGSLVNSQGNGVPNQGSYPNQVNGNAATQGGGYQGPPNGGNAPRLVINSNLPQAPASLVNPPNIGDTVPATWQQNGGQQAGSNVRQVDVRNYGDRSWAAAAAPAVGGVGLPPGNPPGFVATRWINNMQTHVINSPQMTLDYRVDRVGPSGVGAVDLYLTEDEGRTWRRYAEDADLQPPMVVNLPGEGVFGLRLVVTSKAGLGRRPPQEGDAPDMRVEVDTTAPIVKLYRPEPYKGRRDAIVLTWQASDDRNLATSPITLQWAERPDGEWKTIATDLTNSGRYVWTVAPNLVRVYLRVVARDMAGNQGFDETADPILVDLTEPEAKILGISSGIRRP